MHKPLYISQAFFFFLWPINLANSINSIPSIPTFGSFLNPNIANIISSSKCVVHIALKKGPLTEPHLIDYSAKPNQIPIQLTNVHANFSWNEKNKYSRSKNNERYQTFCRFVIFYSQQQPLWDATNLGVWIDSFVFGYFRGGISVRILSQKYSLTTGSKFESFYLLVIAGEETLPNPIYNVLTRASFMPRIVPNFALFLLRNDANKKQASPEICVNSPKSSTPSPENFVCYTLLEDSVSVSRNILPFFKLSQSQPVTCFQNKFSGILEEDGFENTMGVTNLNQIRSEGSYIVLKILGHDLNITANVNDCPSTRRMQIIKITRDVSVMSSFNDGWTSSLISVESQNFRFLTCFSSQNIELWFFAKPFDAETWTGIFLAILVVSGMIVMYGEVAGKSRVIFSSDWMSGLRSIYRQIYWTTGILFEQGLETPGPVGNFGGVRILMGCWILMGTILTNGYRSLAIMDLNAPLPANYPQEFETVSCKSHNLTEDNALEMFFGFHKRNLDESCGYSEYPKNCRSDCFALLSKPRYPLSQGLSYLGGPSYSIGTSLLQTLDYYNTASKSNKLLTEMMQPSVRKWPWSFLQFTFTPKRTSKISDRSPIHDLDVAKSAVEEDILLCRKSVYITSQSEAHLFRNHLLRKYPWSKPLHVSRGEYHAPSTFWRFGADEGHRVVKAFKSIVEFGIYEELLQFAKSNGFKTSNTNVIKKNPITFRPVKLSGNIQTVFLIWVVGLCLSIVVDIMQKVGLKLS